MAEWVPATGGGRRLAKPVVASPPCVFAHQRLLASPESIPDSTRHDRKERTVRREAEEEIRLNVNVSRAADPFDNPTAATE